MGGLLFVYYLTAHASYLSGVLKLSIGLAMWCCGAVTVPLRSYERVDASERSWARQFFHRLPHG